MIDETYVEFAPDINAVTAVPAANQAARDAQAKKRVIRRILWQNRMFFQM